MRSEAKSPVASERRPRLPLWGMRLAVIALSLWTAAAGVLHYRDERQRYIEQREAELAEDLRLQQ